MLFLYLLDLIIAFIIRAAPIAFAILAWVITLGGLYLLFNWLFLIKQSFN